MPRPIIQSGLCPGHQLSGHAPKGHAHLHLPRQHLYGDVILPLATPPSVEEQSAVSNGGEIEREGEGDGVGDGGENQRAPRREMGGA